MESTNTRTAARARRLSVTTLVLLASFLMGVPAMHAKIVIAHRGASGYLPEHTLPAYAMAFAQGADSIEPDLVRTKDGVFICLHDIHLEATTDVEQRYPDRKREDGRWYAADFTLAEIKSLRVHERLPGRFPQDSAAHFEIPTFEEMIALVHGLEQATGRQVSIYPELKAPTFHREQGLAMEQDFLDLVRGHGFRGEQARIFVQCFELGTLVKLRELGSALPHVFLLGDNPAAKGHTSDEGLDAIARVANGIGPSKTLVVKDPDLVTRAHARRLYVHPYTFRADDLGDGFASLEQELERFYDDYGVDGLFTDFPDQARRFLDSRGIDTNTRDLD